VVPSEDLRSFYCSSWLGLLPWRRRSAFSSLPIGRTLIKGCKGLTVQAHDGYYAPKSFDDPAQQAKDEIENVVFSRDEIRDIPTILKIQTPTTGATPAKR
jgi:hypothetical protein